MLKSRLSIIFVLLAVVTTTGGCSAIAITALGIGGTAGVTHAMNGVAYKTFTAPVANVRIAVLEALRRMGVKIELKESDTIKAAASDRDIQIELETVSANTTRMRAVAKKGAFLYDIATANEIIQQTEKVLKPQQRVAVSKQHLALQTR